MAKPRVAFVLPTHNFRAVNGADIVRRIRIADGVEDPPAYYGVHDLERAQAEAEAVGLKSLWYRGRVWHRVIVHGGELVWQADASGPTSSGVPSASAPRQASLLGAW
ncbi:MAG: hypothetical protein ABI780_12020 [Ardenticatenales bacterium]